MVSLRENHPMVKSRKQKPLQKTNARAAPVILWLLCGSVAPLGVGKPWRKPKAKVFHSTTGEQLWNRSS